MSRSRPEPEKPRKKRSRREEADGGNVIVARGTKEFDRICGLEMNGEVIIHSISTTKENGVWKFNITRIKKS